MILLVYVTKQNNVKEIKNLMRNLTNALEMKDLGKFKSFWGTGIVLLKVNSSLQ